MRGEDILIGYCGDKMVQAAPLTAWPWKNMGMLKYLLYGPLVAKLLYSFLHDESPRETYWCLHVLIVCALRGLIHQLWHSYGSMLFLTRSKKIIKRSVDFKQIDDEWHWDNFLILQTLVAATLFYVFPILKDLPLIDWRGLVLAPLLHMGVSEPLYYWIHKQYLHSNNFFSFYHSLHHSSPVPESFTASHGTMLEHLILFVIVGIPTLGPSLIGLGSISLIYSYLLIFDFLRCMGHSNIEALPHGIYQSFPLLKYLLYTSTYHSLHHKDMTTNFCLFMPFYDKLGNTLNENSWDLHKKISAGEKDRVPDFVFLAHIVDIMSSMHAPFVLRSFSSLPFTTQLFLLPCWPTALLIVMVMWASSKTFLISSYMLRGRLQQTWAVPRCGFQYFLPFATKGINDQIEAAILRADRLGIKVMSLAALNKNESLNGGGTLFVRKHPDLKVRVVHGNTLTAAVILNEIPKDCEEVFLTGATSKLGRAIALYLCRMKVRVMMLTLSVERFQSIQKEAPAEFQQYLIQVTKYQAAQSCKTWIVGKWLSPSKQRWAPPGTHFHQFVVPPIFSFRRDCTYGSLAAMRLPDDVEGLGSCEYTMERGVVHACHAGGVVHCLEGWTHHEVGAIDVNRIDMVWKAALKHGLKPVL